MLSVTSWKLLHYFAFVICKQGSQDISVSIVTGYGPDNQDWIPNRDEVFLFSTISGPSLVPTQPPA
jgi:hypothetical protein